MKNRIVAILAFCLISLCVFSQDNLYYVAQRLNNEGKSVEAFNLMKTSAERNHAASQAMLGMYYLSGVGVTPDIDKAVYWTKKSAEQGNVMGCCELGTYYLEGLGVEKDISLAKKWLGIAAKSGDSDRTAAHAMYLLGLIASEENESSFSQGYWFLKALEKDPDHLGALNRLGWLCNEANLPGEAYSYFIRGAELGDPLCQYQVAVFYTVGPEVFPDWPVRRDLKQATYWAKKAAKQGHTKAAILVIDIENGKI